MNGALQKSDTQSDLANTSVDDIQRDNEIYTVNWKAFEYMNHPILFRLE